MTNVKQLSPKRWKFTGKNITAFITESRIGLAEGYKAQLSNGTDRISGSLPALTALLNKLDRQEPKQ